MLLEYINYSADFSEHEFNSLIDTFNKNISTVVLPSYYLKIAKSKLKESCKVSCLIDFPLGISDYISRIEACKYAIKQKSDYVDVVMSTNLLANRKYDKIRDEITNIKTICDESNTSVRYILEYRYFEHHSLKKACEILLSFGISTISLSTGANVDILSDFIIASKFLTSAQSLNLNIILSANFWSENHMNLIKQNNFFAVRSQHISSLQNLAAFLQKQN